MSDDTPFKVYVRREPGYELRVSLKFQVMSGLGLLGLREPGRAEPGPAASGEESDISGGVVQASRFIHIPRGTQRRNSYAFSRLSPELLERLPGSTWVELESVTEYGFRYLVLPQAALTEAAPAQVRAAPAAAQADPGRPPSPRSPVAAQRSSPQPPPGRGPSSQPHPQRRVPPASQPNHPPRTAPPQTPPPPMAMEPSLGEAALNGLSRDKAIGVLRAELAKGAQLHQLVTDLHRRLDASLARERDLLEVLRRWQERETR